MNKHEHLMYQVLGNISEAGIPIVFKGALITKLILAEHRFVLLNRPTIDIDANWLDTPPSMDGLVNTIQQSLGDMQEHFHAVAIREYGENKSAGISIRVKTMDEEVMSMDISIKPVFGSRVYYYGKIGIKGVLPNEILADKITVLSKPVLFRRAKDLIDVYALAHCLEVQTVEIHDLLQSKSAIVGGFTELYSRHDDVKHAYNKLKGIEDKPLFKDVYSYLIKFIYPFALQDKTPRIWNNNTQNWDDI